MNKYTSLEFSKKLAEVGFDRGTIFVYAKEISSNIYKLLISTSENDSGDGYYLDEHGTIHYSNHFDNEIKTYDILNDLCVKYAKEVWGDKDICFPDKFDSNAISVSYIVRLLQQGKQDEAEQYIEENSILFNQHK
jgi:hypothetical protein